MIVNVLLIAGVAFLLLFGEYFAARIAARKGQQ